MVELLNTGDPRRRKLDELQKKIGEIDTEIASIENAPLTADDIRARVAAAVDRELETHPHAGLRAFALPGHEAGLFTPPAAYSPLVNLATLAIVCGRDSLVDNIVRHATAAPYAPAGLPLAERAPRIEALKAKRRALERAEETEALRLEAQGAVVVRREDVDVELLLQLWAEAA